MIYQDLFDLADKKLGTIPSYKRFNQFQKLLMFRHNQFLLPNFGFLDGTGRVAVAGPFGDGNFENLA